MRLMGLIAIALFVCVAPNAFAVDLPFDPDVATRQWLDTMGPEATARSNAYFEGGYWIQFVGVAISIAISMLLMILGFAKGVRTWLEKTVKAYFLVVLGMALFYQLVSTVLTFPFSYYVGFVREHEFGLATQDFSGWFSEYLMSAGIGLVIGSIFIAILYLIIRALKNTWWIWGTAASLIMIAALQIAAPVYLAPLFNTYQPMQEGQLRDEIIGMAQANGVPASDVYVFDVSRQSNRVTANVSGFAGTTRISLSDTLLERGGPSAVREVMGHEIGHYVLRHTNSILIMVGALVAIMFALANVLFKSLSKGERWGVRDIADPAGMPLLFAVLAFLGAVATPIQNNIIRYHEQQADIFGLNVSREPDGFAQSALLLSEYRKMEPSPLEEWFFYDHPSGYDRIHMAMVWKANEMAAGRYPLGPGGPPEGWRPDFVVVSEDAAATAPEATEPSPAAPSN
ncbi:MAG: M48 family metallopeptidase [Hyphomonadaceae bacterium]